MSDSTQNSAPDDSAAAAPSGSGRSRWWIWLVGGVAILVIGGVIGGGITAATASSSSSSASVCNATKVADEVLPSIVTISATNGNSGGTGSGEVIRSAGYIMTNNHVVSLAANGGSVTVLFANGVTEPATITGRDPKADLAVVKVAQTNAPVIAFGNSSNLLVGQPVVALGAPLGLSNTVTSGIVSALNRTVEVPSDNGETALLASAIQTDAAINPGNSGGALVNCNGQLVGVPSAGATAPSTGRSQSTGSIGLGFAIPSDVAMRITNDIIATGSPTHSYFGLQVTPIPASAAEEMGSPQGLYVAGVVPGSPAADAGLQEGDIITEINGQAVNSSTDLESYTITHAPGEKLTITYYRGGKSSTTTLTLGTQP
jgi:putative serine protease PepD